MTSQQAAYIAGIIDGEGSMNTRKLLPAMVDIVKSC